MAAVPVIPAFLKKTIVTDLLTKPSEEVDPAYIFNVVLGKDKSIVAASSSTNAIKIYDFNTQALVSQCVGHSETITEIVFSPTEPFVLYSSSMDGTIGTWDVRTGESTGTLKSQGGLFSVSVGGPDNAALAAGGESVVNVWDLRTGKISCKYTESHMEDVTQVRFHPNGALFSGSMDGLICVFDITKSNEDDAVQNVLNAQQSINRTGFFGPNSSHVYALTTAEELHVWSLDDMESPSIDFGMELRDNLSQQCGVTINYFVDCKNHPQTGDLLLLGGSVEGDIYVFGVSQTKIEPVSHLKGGHTSVVRDMYLDSDSQFAITCGEDSKISFWTHGQTQDLPSHPRTQRESVTSTQRHNPYGRN